MAPPHSFPGNQPLNIAIAISLVLHALVLFFPRSAPKADRPAQRLEATLAPRQPAPVTAPPVAPPETTPSKPQQNKKVIAIENPKGRQSAPRWSAAEKEEMDRFLRELGEPAKAPPSLAQRSLAMAREMARQQEKQGRDEREIVERLPGGPPVDPFSLEMYLDGLVKKLNRSAAFVKNDPRSRGMKTAEVLVRINPDGSLRSFRILKAADQQDEIAFIRSVVEQAVPFSTFPADLKKSARSLALMICVLPANAGGGGIGFTRMADGSGC